jgi:phosphinothricin acetyltransferase
VECVIRPGRGPDLAALTAIYNHYVLHAPCTFDLQVISVQERAAWLAHYAESGPHRIVVAERHGQVVGYATSSRLRPKPAYDTSVETSVYVVPGHTGQGIGAQLYAGLFAAIQGEDLHRAYAAIAQPNEASVALHEKFGFRCIGVYSEVGRKFGRYWDVAWYEKELW